MLQLWTGFYLFWWSGVYTALLVLVALATSADIRRRLATLVRGHWPTLVGGAVAGLLGMVSPTRRYLEVARSTGVRRFLEVHDMQPRPASWFHLGHENLWGIGSSTASFPEVYWKNEHVMGLGTIALLLALGGYLFARDRRLRLFAVPMIVLGCAVTIWPGDLSVWRWVYEHVPGAGAIRAVARIAIINAVVIWIGAAVAFDRLLRTPAWLLCLPLGL